MKKIVAAICVAGFFAIIPTNVGAETFKYSYRNGEKYRIVSTVVEDVYINRSLSHRAEILNRIAVEVTGTENGTARHRATFQTSERSTGVRGASFQWAREYVSIFDRDASGRYTIGKEYWMPVVRDVPILPEKDLSPGESWSAAGEEVHDFRDSFGIIEPYHIPIQVQYTYVGERKPGVSGSEEIKSKNFPTFTVSYRIFDEPLPPQSGGKIWPVRIMGASDQVVYWDREFGRPAAYEERFRIIFELSNGLTVEYRGTAEALIVESTPMDRDKIAQDIAKDIKRLEIPDAGVRVTDEGVVINLDDIRFQPDSAILMQGERAKLDQIAEILQKYKERDIQVGGHTALAGTEEGRAKLSQERAAAVAEYLIGKGIREADRVVVRGYGATKPVADNTTEEGKKKNRRVEITLLEN
ncbi:MAG: OmpA family protein [Treponemataceae bacterium]